MSVKARSVCVCVPPRQSETFEQMRDMKWRGKKTQPSHGCERRGPHEVLGSGALTLTDAHGKDGTKEGAEKTAREGGRAAVPAVAPPSAPPLLEALKRRGL